MANLGKWGNVGSWTSALATSTDLDSKTTTTAIALGAAITNSSGLDLLMDLSLILGSVNPSGSPYWEVHLCKLDSGGSNYEDRSGQTQLGIIAVTTGSTAKTAGMNGVPIPAGDFKLQLVNQMGVTSAASGNSFKYRTYSMNLNG